MKKLIIAIVGPSGSGKTSLSLEMQKQRCIPAICSITSRPMRPGEQSGREHWFVGDTLAVPQQPFAYTFFGGYHYWTELWQFEECDVCSYVVDEVGLNEIKTKWSDKFNIVSVYVKRDIDDSIDKSRADRDKNRTLIPENRYDIVLTNNSSYESFIDNSLNIISDYITLNFDI